MRPRMIGISTFGVDRMTIPDAGEIRRARINKIGLGHHRGRADVLTVSLTLSVDGIDGIVCGGYDLGGRFGKTTAPAFILGLLEITDSSDFDEIKGKCVRLDCRIDPPDIDISRIGHITKNIWIDKGMIDNE